MKRKVLSIFAVFILVFSITLGTSFAVESSSSYQQKINEAKKKSEEVQGQIDSALQEVEDLNTSITEVEGEIEEISGQITEINESIEEKQKDLDEKQALLDERLSAAYMNDNNTYLEAFFTGGIINFISNYDMIKQIAEYDTSLIQEVKDVKAGLENEKIKLENMQIEKKAKSKELNDLKTQKQEKVNSLTDEQKSIQAQIEEYDNKMKEIAAKERAAASSYSGSTGSGVVASSGALAWPVPSSRTITSQYGYRIHPISGTRKLHAGVDIGAAGGSNIVAAESGTVILSSMGYNGGYGNYVIIDHGNGLTTRYAHCSALYVSVGQSVSKGQTIAAVGSTGASTGDHCHFEVRINGATQNPLNYV